jgi:uncharacterized protein DUF6364
MSTKLTLTLNNDTIEKAKTYAKNNKISLSKLVEHYFKTLSDNSNNYSENISQITRELSGIAKLKTDKTNKELLTEALNKKYL